MFYCDSHIHSRCSPDGHNTMREMAMASLKKGVKRVCFTDHIDIDGSAAAPSAPDCAEALQSVIKMYRDTVAEPVEGIEVHLGMELGEANHDPEKARKLSAEPELDFVLGSLHQLKNRVDFFYQTYADEKYCTELINNYLDELIELADMDCFDVMAHIGYPIRYIRRAGFKTPFTMESHGDGLQQLLKRLIENGRGIEINCSGFRNRYLCSSVPTEDILRCYKALGGEIITIGSDAHRCSDAASGLAEGYEILSRLGFRYQTVFEKRKPIFIKI